MKRFIKFFLIAGSIISIIAVIIVEYDFMIHGAFSDDSDRYYTSSVKKGEWKRYFVEIPLPSQTKLLTSGFKVGQINTGKSEELDYGFYWIVKSDLTCEELIKYYMAYAEESNQKFGGYETNIEVEPFHKRFFDYSFDNFQSEWEQIERQEEKTDQIWMVFAIKPGRGWFKN